MPHDRDRSIHQLDLERRWLTAKLDHGAYADRPAEIEAAMRRVEDLDLATAAAPAAALVVEFAPFVPGVAGQRVTALAPAAGAW
jgi:hypothetical protein